MQPTVIRRSWKSFFAWWWTFILIVPWIIAALVRQSSSLIVHGDRVVLRTGLLAKNERVVKFESIRTVETRQGVFDRMLGVGQVAIATAGTDGYEIVMPGVTNPAAIRDMLDSKASRSAA